ncbi:threonine/homoserine/homoserine lactone efflux protein [Chelatococcus caeni]|uniref:Threonine/homoserine/homoserine lactone efflux protein n=1 Tax=Chelatococcus caeni TaxID=1348468 RepID=A0A840BYE7_9HYPH|nr:LysE family transporter [Chelatococcus caeni]MBB4015297.1 threonine/homoserine/homoserine lactone efflux protein [Chelatococcus caeni]
MDAVPLFILTSLALVGSPGPNTLSLAALGAAFGVRRGLAYMAGLNLGMVAVVALVGSGLWAAVLSYPRMAPVVTFAASAYLIFLAYRIATAPPLGTAAAEAPGRAPRWYAGVTLSLANPKAYVAVAAVFSRYSLWPNSAVADQFAKGALLLATIVLVNLLWLAAGALLARSVVNPKVGRAVNMSFAGLLVLSVAVASFL